MFEYPQLSTSFVTSSSRSVAYDSVGYTLILLNNLGQMLVIKLVWMPPLDMLRLHPILIRLDAIIFRSIPLGKRICMDCQLLDILRTLRPPNNRPRSLPPQHRKCIEILPLRLVWLVQLLF